MTDSSRLTESASLPAGFRGPRGDILVELKRESGLTAGDLSARLGLSLNAVRHHLKELAADSLVVRDRERRGVGAPSHAYRLSPSGENLFPRRYDVVLTQLLGRIAEGYGRGAVLDAVEDRFRGLAERIRLDVGDASVQERLERVARILADEGYMADWAQSPGEARLTEHNCAIRALAERFPEICEAEARFLQAVLAVPVERQKHILTGCQSCEYSVRLEPAPGPQPKRTSESQVA